MHKAQLYFLVHLTLLHCCCTQPVIMLRPGKEIIVNKDSPFWKYKNKNIFCYAPMDSIYIWSPLIYTHISYQPLEGRATKLNVTSFGQFLTRTSRNFHNNVDYLIYKVSRTSGPLSLPIYLENLKEYCYRFETEQTYILGVRRINLLVLLVGILLFILEHYLITYSVHFYWFSWSTSIVNFLGYYAIFLSDSELFYNVVLIPIFWKLVSLLYIHFRPIVCLIYEWRKKSEEEEPKTDDCDFTSISSRRVCRRRF